jgi:hypothetical protein
LPGARRNALRVRIGTTGNGTRRYWVHADGTNLGIARVGLFWPGQTTPAMSWLVRARPRPAAPGGELFLQTRLPMCGYRPNAIIRVRDPLSRRWSSARRIATGCTSL